MRPASGPGASAPSSPVSGELVGLSVGSQGPVPASSCFSSIAQLKGEVNVQLLKQFPFSR